MVWMTYVWDGIMSGTGPTGIDCDCLELSRIMQSNEEATIESVPPSREFLDSCYYIGSAGEVVKLPQCHVQGTNECAILSHFFPSLF